MVGMVQKVVVVVAVKAVITIVISNYYLTCIRCKAYDFLKRGVNLLVPSLYFCINMAVGCTDVRKRIKLSLV